MKPAPLPRGSLAALALLAALAAGCAVNPATGKHQLMLVSERQEVEIGRESDRSISAEMGLYDDAKLQAYVQDLGRRLAARSERPDLGWTFRVIDDPVVNAFALPGGFVYVTRGILAHMNNEAELASVIGHEIGHVTARHGASQMTKAQLAQVGLGLGSILAPERADRFGGIAASGLGLLFLKHGRDDERQADGLGLRYMVVAGYDPRPMADMFDMLERVSASAGGGGVPAWASTHPAPENRRSWTENKIAAMGRDFSGWSIEREGFLARIDGLTFGEDPRQGYFKGQLFFHPALRFRMDFPEGWKSQNRPRAVVSASPEKDAVLQLTLAAQASPEAALAAFFSETGARRTGPAMAAISGLPTAGDGFVVEAADGNLQGRVGFVEHGGKVFRLLAYAAQHRWSAHEPAIRRSLASFDRLTDARALDVQPQRLAIVRADRTMPLEEFASRQRATVDVETLELLNRLDPGRRVQEGSSYKLVLGGELP